jgi:hypothetical protein
VQQQSCKTSWRRLNAPGSSETAGPCLQLLQQCQGYQRLPNSTAAYGQQLNCMPTATMCTAAGTAMGHLPGLPAAPQYVACDLGRPAWTLAQCSLPPLSSPMPPPFAPSSRGKPACKQRPDRPTAHQQPPTSCIFGHRPAEPHRRHRYNRAQARRAYQHQHPTLLGQRHCWRRTGCLRFGCHARHSQGWHTRPCHPCAQQPGCHVAVAGPAAAGARPWARGAPPEQHQQQQHRRGDHRWPGI